MPEPDRYPALTPAVALLRTIRVQPRTLYEIGEALRVNHQTVRRLIAAWRAADVLITERERKDSRLKEYSTQVKI